MKLCSIFNSYFSFSGSREEQRFVLNRIVVLRSWGVYKWLQHQRRSWHKGDHGHRKEITSSYNRLVCEPSFVLLSLVTCRIFRKRFSSGGACWHRLGSHLLVAGLWLRCQVLNFEIWNFMLVGRELAFYPCYSPTWDVLQGGTSATQRHKFHTDDVNRCLCNKSCSAWVPDANLFNSTFLLVDFGWVLCSFANELQKNSNASCIEEYILQNNIGCFAIDS